MVKFEWIGEGTYQIDRFPLIRKRGRKPFQAASEDHVKALLGTGVFARVAGILVRYSGGAEVCCQECGGIKIDSEGFAEVDEANLCVTCKQCLQAGFQLSGG